MSVVTTVFAIGYLSDKDKAWIEAYPSYSHSPLFLSGPAEIDLGKAPGNKMPETSLRVGAYNYMDVEEFFTYLDTYTGWICPAEVVIVCNTTSPVDESFVWRPKGNRRWGIFEDEGDKP